VKRKKSQQKRTELTISKNKRMKKESIERERLPLSQFFVGWKWNAVLSGSFWFDREQRSSIWGKADFRREGAASILLNKMQNWMRITWKRISLAMLRWKSRAEQGVDLRQ
jgi:hypothetical protein